MSVEQQHSAEALQAFEDRHSEDGLFRRYATGRVSGLARRQIVTVFGAVALAFLAGPLVGVCAFCIALAGELVEAVVLYGLLPRLDLGLPLKRQMRSAIFVATLQAMTIGICAVLAWVTAAGNDGRYFALAYLAGASFNAGIVMAFCRPAAVARIATYCSVIALLFFYDALMGAGPNRAMAYDVLGTLTLGYMVYVGVSYMNHVFRRRVQFERELLQGNKAIAETNARLVERERHARRLATVAETANDSIVITDHTGKIEWVNDSFTRITGYAAEEALGRTPSDLLNAPETSKRTIAKIMRAAEAKRPLRTQILNRTKANGRVWIETSLTPILNDAGELLSTVAVERDISQAKQKERELAEARHSAEQAARAKDNFLASISHELRTPLNGIIGMAELLIGAKLPPEQAENAEVILSSSDALLQIINDVLDVSKLESGKMTIAEEPFSPSDCVSAVMTLMRPMAQQKGLGFTWQELRPLPPCLLGDSGRLRQILLNLLGNALKFTQSGEVILRTDADLLSGRAELKLEVIDTGIGIAPDRVDHVFDRFTQAEGDTTRKFGGTGLGLTISRMLAEAMGGDITVTSVVGEGSTFTITLSLKEGAFETSQVPQEMLAAPREGLRVLVAEDNRTNRLLIKKLLAPYALDLTFAHDGAMAVQSFRDAPPDVVLMDVSMPEKDGLQATQEIRAHEAESRAIHTPIIALTANAFASDRERCLAAGMDAFLTKPIRKGELIAELSRQTA